MLRLLSDWDKTYDKLDVMVNELHLKDVDLTVTTWVEGPTDTLLIRVVDGIYYVQCWNGGGVRAALAGLLGLPVQVVRE